MKLFPTSVVVLTALAMQAVYADDTEIYRTTTNRVNPNVVFVIDTSGSMAYSASADEPPGNKKNRLQIVQDAANNAVQNLDPSLPINIAIMRFDQRSTAGSSNNDGAKGGFVTLPFTPTNSEENKSKIQNNINSFSLDNIGGGTPITESIFEAYRYLTGKAAVHGKPTVPCTNRANTQPAGCTANLKGISVTGMTRNRNGTYNVNYGSSNISRIGSVAESLIQSGSDYIYDSPVEATCQKNHIVLFTDGAASADTTDNQNILTLTDGMTLPTGLSRSTCSTSTAGSCAALFAYFLQNTDHFVDSDLTGHNDENAAEVVQPINLHVVGGFAGIQPEDEKNLNNMALYGHPLTEEYYDVVNGEYKSKHYYKSDDEDGLTEALRKVFGGIASTAGNFAAPTVAVNAFNSLEHREELYYAIFQPGEMPGWSGNLKRFKLASDGTIRDSRDNHAIDPETGTFKESSRSIWSEEIDGSVVTRGGIASKLPATRAVYTNLAQSKTIISNSNKITETNSSITVGLLNSFLPSNMQNLNATQRENILKWARGLNPNTNSPRKTLADPLHSTPVVVSYQEGDTVKDTLYMGTNVGYIHAFDPQLSSPSELWAFMPKELLPNLAVYQMGAASFLKAYGMDGPMSVYHQDTNKNRLINTNEKAYLTAGMRRGGKNYYLLDISERNNPKLEAQITGGEGDFHELGQTWSKMIPATVVWNGVRVPVYFFGGGYDPDEDNYTQRTEHQQGNAIYMVAADSTLTGKKPFDLLWKISGHQGNTKGPTNSSMTSSFASDLTLVDNNGDGTVDLIYAADVGGRLWRIDIHAQNTAANNFASAGVIADFNDGSTTENIRFFTRPDVIYTDYGNIEVEDPNDSSQIILREIGRYQITIGSGFRARPLSTAVQDKIFIINDYDTEGAPEAGYTTLGLSNLASHTRFSTATAEQRRNGFYYQLTGLGEKVLSSTLTLNNTVYVPTFRPSDSTLVQGCQPDVGMARLIKISTVNPAITTERIIEEIDLKQGGIVPNPVLIFTPSGDDEVAEPVIAIGTEVIETDDDFNLLEKIYWREK